MDARIKLDNCRVSPFTFTITTTSIYRIYAELHMHIHINIGDRETKPLYTCKKEINGKKVWAPSSVYIHTKSLPYSGNKVIQEKE